MHTVMTSINEKANRLLKLVSDQPTQATFACSTAQTNNDIHDILQLLSSLLLTTPSSSRSITSTITTTTATTEARVPQVLL